MPEVVRKLPKPAPAPEPAHQPGVDMMPVVEAMERQTVALVDVLANVLKKESTEQAKRWVFTIVRNPRTGDLEDGS